MPPDLAPAGVRPPAGEPRPSPWLRFSPWRLAVLFWTAALTVVCVRGLIWSQSHSTFHYFADGSKNWLAGNELYQHLGGSCRYSPVFHVLMIPFSLINERVAALLWRLLNAAAFLGGLACWIRCLLPRTLSKDQYGFLFLLALPLSLGSLNNAQANPLMVGLILLALAAAQSQRWSWAALGIAVACLLKIYPLATGLLLVLLYPRSFSWRLGLALAVGVALPFVLAKPDYVARQYVNWFHLLHADDRSQWVLDPDYNKQSYRDAWQLICLAGLPISLAVYRVIQLLAAVSVAGLCWYKARTEQDQRPVLNTVLGLSACWMTLFGPATESCTYILLAPTLSWLGVEVWRRPGARGKQVLVTASFAVFVGSYVANWFPYVSRVHALGPHPIAALLLLSAVVWDSLSRSSTTDEKAETAGRAEQIQAA